MRTLESAAPNPRPSSPWREGCALGLVLLGLFLAGVGSRPLANPDEGRYAEIPREMIATGDWITPRLNGVKYFEKPPLGYWLVATAETVLGPGEAGVRLMPALSAWLGCMLTWLAARALYGRRVGLLAAAVLATSLFYFGFSQLLLLDMLVSALMAGALFGFIVGVRLPPGRARRLVFYGVYVSAALATLAKGLIGFLLPGAVMFSWLLLYHQWRQLRPFHLPVGALLFLGITVPWHWAVIARNPDFAWFYFVHEHLLRFTTDVHERVQPWWFFLPLVCFGLFPWSGFLWPALRRSLADGWTGRRAHAVEGFWVIWFALILLFFSSSHSKLVPYILPVFPALAVLVARECERLIAGDAWPRSLRLGAGASLGVMALLALGLLLGPHFAKIPGQAAALRPYSLAGFTVVMLASGLGFRALHARRAQALLAALTAGSVGLGLVLTLAGSTIQKPGTKDLALVLARQDAAAAPVFTYQEFFHDLPYYLHREVQAVDYDGEFSFGKGAEPDSPNFLPVDAFRARWADSAPAFLIISKRRAGPLLQSPGFHCRIIGENERILLCRNVPQS